jgi:hypothetical protein
MASDECYMMLHCLEGSGGMSLVYCYVHVHLYSVLCSCCCQEIWCFYGFCRGHSKTLCYVVHMSLYHSNCDNTQSIHCLNAGTMHTFQFPYVAITCWRGLKELDTVHNVVQIVNSNDRCSA